MNLAITDLRTQLTIENVSDLVFNSTTDSPVVDFKYQRFGCEIIDRSFQLLELYLNIQTRKKLHFKSNILCIYLIRFDFILIKKNTNFKPFVDTDPHPSVATMRRHRHTMTY